ncbi:low affinity immunoglobulin gamma Fc region receptor II-b isoform X1 [Panthera pardus]|uniref:low affinity immunoglobulin gamma Fc region receptor II-b isoform X1 n=1 Tax=Panthera pardus TaxID=9691 RepID=UPI002380765E|nr:low affinity immunoglobulin gamma Fc region receptor II-b isoform X1 [Panthera pardus]
MQIPSTRPLPAARSDRAECVPCPPLGDMLLWTALLFLGPVLGTPGLPKAVVDLEPPWILVLREDNVTLKCQGAHTAGDHSIRWFHNGSSIPTQVRPNYSFKATEKDRGEYACQTDQTSLSDPVYLDVFSARGLLPTPPPRPTLSPAGSDRPGGKALRTGRALTCVSLSLQEGKEVRQSPSTKPPQPLPPPVRPQPAIGAGRGCVRLLCEASRRLQRTFVPRLTERPLDYPKNIWGPRTRNWALPSRSAPRPMCSRRPQVARSQPSLRRTLPSIQVQTWYEHRLCREGRASHLDREEMCRNRLLGPRGSSFGFFSGLYFIIITFLSLFILRERERNRAREQERGRERRSRERIPSRF